MVASNQLQNKIALITGASRGIGAAVAKRFAAEGAHVILVARTVGGLEETDDAISKAGGKATLVPLDLMEYGKIDALGAQIAERFGALDILVGNAGILGDLTPLSHGDATMWDKVMATNLTANWRLIRSLDPLLRASKAGRAIFVTTQMTLAPHAYWGPYAVSKIGLEMLVKTYAAELATTNVKANLIDPGIIDTAMLASAMPGMNTSKISKPDSITDIFVNLALASCTTQGEIHQANKK
jgi:NAD(P)-dependent dehydrogenase (short-subunit alcohol dehydrogenase family)